MRMLHRQVWSFGNYRDLAATAAAFRANPRGAYVLGKNVQPHGFKRGGIDFGEHPAAQAHDADRLPVIENVTDRDHTETLNPQALRAN